MPEKCQTEPMSPRRSNSDTTFNLRVWRAEIEAFREQARREGLPDLSAWIRKTCRDKAGVTLDPKTGMPVVGERDSKEGH